jgi:dienelactone hydrolase
MLLVSSTANAAGTSVSYEVNGEPYEGYFISPSPNAALVLLVHDWDGLTDYEVKRANMLADMGYAVFAADLFGAGVRPTEVKDKRQHTGELLQGALKTAGSKGANVHNAVAMGYCFGGAPVLEFARSGADLKGFVTFHGGLKTPAGQDYSKTKGKLLILHGTADTNILSYSQHISIMLSPLI